MSVKLNGKIMGALIATAIAGGGGYVATQQQKAPVPQERVVYDPRPANARDWGGLTAKEMSALTDNLRRLKPQKVEIYCGGTYCKALAEDLDEAFESSGFDSYLPHPLFDMGKGMGISPDSEASREVARALKDASGGRISLEVIAPTDDKGREVKVDGIAIAIARKPAK